MGLEEEMLEKCEKKITEMREDMSVNLGKALMDLHYCFRQDTEATTDMKEDALSTAKTRLRELKALLGDEWWKK